MQARTSARSNGLPANSTARIDTATLNGRVRFAFGTIIMAKMPDGVKDTKVAKGMRMLWPHMSKDLATVPPDQLYKAATFISLMMQLCIQGVPDDMGDMSFEDYLQAIFDGEIHILPGTATVIDEAKQA
jgi:hypothetical protein